MGKKKKCNTLGVIALCVLFFILGMACLYILNNFTTKHIYKFISCTNNKHSCEFENWDGVCTGEIRNKCCEDIRYCEEGETEYGYDCLDRYCPNEGKTCDYIVTVQGFQCQCRDVI